ncbi:MULTISPECIES: lycopene cyclase domain-containing protein [Saccharopolyspora]|uniref:Lycopene cyclase domain-containing protein n=2 Tax=Saccharopolyspora TaxID=1835 RepID=A0A1I6UEN3_9PSEU|nr:MULTISPECIES: lycopene cyclase domain-containing protein [Saccharopolyspora]TWG07613.1 lycopene cyclase domain-containing protein [Saccharopolyspora dendranthemae]SFS99871.1 lycopene cyclase domain-containing protein [Saccharopolyspora flava]
MIGIGYTVPAVLSVLIVLVWEAAVLRTGLFAKPSYWLTTVIVLGFQIPVDGLLTRLDEPTVIYAAEHLSGVRFPWDIPVEDFLFGFSLVTSVLLLWERQRGARTPPQRGGEAP